MMMSFSVAQNKYRLNMHKENSTKIKNIERYKKLLAAHYAKLGLKKIFGPRPNSYVL
jgi:hypothetical protein